MRGNAPDAANEASATPSGDTELAPGAAAGNADGINPEAVTIQQNVAYGSESWQKMDLCMPKGAQGKLPAMLVIHGGGGDKRDMAPACKRFASVGFLAAAINWYMQTPAYPQLVKDAQLALANIKHRPDVDPTRVGSMGVSAGGYLSMMLGTLDFPDKVGCVVSVAGPTDFTDPAAQTEAVFRNQFGPRFFGDKLNDQAYLLDASPIAHVSPTMANMIFFRSVNDHLVPLSQFDRMNAALAQIGKKANLIQIDGQGPGHALQTNAATALKLWDDERSFVDNCLHVSR